MFRSIGARGVVLNSFEQEFSTSRIEFNDQDISVAVDNLARALRQPLSACPGMTEGDIWPFPEPDRFDELYVKFANTSSRTQYLSELEIRVDDTPIRRIEAELPIGASTETALIPIPLQDVVNLLDRGSRVQVAPIEIIDGVEFESTPCEVISQRSAPAITGSFFELEPFRLGLELHVEEEGRRTPPDLEIRGAGTIRLPETRPLTKGRNEVLYPLVGIAPTRGVYELRLHPNQSWHVVHLATDPIESLSPAELVIPDTASTPALFELRVNLRTGGTAPNQLTGASIAGGDTFMPRAYTNDQEPGSLVTISPGPPQTVSIGIPAAQARELARQADPRIRFTDISQAGETDVLVIIPAPRVQLMVAASDQNPAIDPDQLINVAVLNNAPVPIHISRLVVDESESMLLTPFQASSCLIEAYGSNDCAFDPASMRDRLKSSNWVVAVRNQSDNDSSTFDISRGTHTFVRNATLKRHSLYSKVSATVDITSKDDIKAITVQLLVPTGRLSGPLGSEMPGVPLGNDRYVAEYRSSDFNSELDRLDATFNEVIVSVVLNGDGGFVLNAYPKFDQVNEAIMLVVYLVGIVIAVLIHDKRRATFATFYSLAFPLISGVVGAVVLLSGNGSTAPAFQIGVATLCALAVVAVGIATWSKNAPLIELRLASQGAFYTDALDTETRRLQSRLVWWVFGAGTGVFVAAYHMLDLQTGAFGVF